MIYFDSSALVKRYLKEKGSGRLREIAGSAPAISTSKLAYPEILSAFARKRKEKNITESELHLTVRRFENDWNSFFVIEFQDELLPIISKVIKRHCLKGADSVHLSSALWLQHAMKENCAFVASDINLLKAAESEKLSIINPEEDSK